MCKKRYLIVLSVALVLLFLIGSFFDLEIAKTVYAGQGFQENAFGVIFAFIGVIPTFVGWSFLGASIFFLARKRVSGRKKRGWLIALSVLLFTLSFFYFCNTLFLVNENAFSVHWAIAYSIGIAVIVGAGYLGYKLTKSSDNPQLLRKVLFLTVVSLVIMAVIMLTKEFMSRPRYRFVLQAGDEEFYRNWWQSGKEIKKNFGDAVSDEFASFPSGHSAYAMFAIFLFPLFGQYVDKLKRYETLLFVGGIVWWALTAFSRMTVGAHYLTDVGMAGLTAIGVYALVGWIRKILNKKAADTLLVEKETER